LYKNKIILTLVILTVQTALDDPTSC